MPGSTLLSGELFCFFFGIQVTATWAATNGQLRAYPSTKLSDPRGVPAFTSLSSRHQHRFLPTNLLYGLHNARSRGCCCLPPCFPADAQPHQSPGKPPFSSVFIIIIIIINNTRPVRDSFPKKKQRSSRLREPPKARAGLPVVGPLIEFSTTPRQFLTHAYKEVLPPPPLLSLFSAPHSTQWSLRVGSVLCLAPTTAEPLFSYHMVAGSNVHVGPAGLEDNHHHGPRGKQAVL